MTQVPRVSAGAFSLCAAVYLLGLKRYQPVARTATFIGLIGYTTDQNGMAIVKPLFQGALNGRDLVSIPELYDNPLEIEQRRKKEFVDDGAGGLTEVEKQIAALVTRASM